MLTAQTLQFLRDLEANNDRSWFQPRKAEFEAAVKIPMLQVVSKLNTDLADAAPEYVTDPQKSVYRIYRDTRFSKNKTPYKTHASALLWDRRLGKDGGAGLYFHLSPKEFLVAGGLYQTMPEALLAVRQHIAADPGRLTSILKNRSVQSSFGDLQGDKLSRPPKGFSSDHPAVEYLKQKDLLLETTFSPEEALGNSGLSLLKKRILTLLPFVVYLNEPLLTLRRKAQADPLRSSRSME